MRKIIPLLIILAVLITSIFIYKDEKLNKEIAINGVIDLSNWNFEKNGTVNLDGEWELYYNELLEPEDLKNRIPEKYFYIPDYLKKQLEGVTTGCMTLKLKVLAKDSVVYGLRIKSMLSASKIWVNGVLQEEIGVVGKSFKEEKAIYLPTYSYFTAKDKSIDIVIQTSNFRDIYPVIKSMDFGLKNQIMNKCLLNVSVDLLIIGCLLILELLFLLLYKLYKKEKSYLYFSLMCFLIQLRCLFLNERIIVHFYPNMNYEILSKISAITYYLFVPIYVLVLKGKFKDISSRIVNLALVFGGAFTFVCLATNNIFYDRLAILSQVITIILIIYILIFLIKKNMEKDENSLISLVAFLVLALTAVNDILVNDTMKLSNYIFQIGMAVFAFLETYILSIKYSKGFNSLEQLSIQNKKIYEKSIRDNLTNLYNRNYFEQIIAHSIKEYKENDEVFTLLMIDIDYFKTINDTYGHVFGDKVLVNVSNILIESVRVSDYVSRYGGEEFLILLPKTNEIKAKEIAERIRYNIENFEWDKEVNITISIGLYENEMYCIEECIDHVDKIMYRAKERGRNRVEVMN